MRPEDVHPRALQDTLRKRLATAGERFIGSEMDRIVARIFRFDPAVDEQPRYEVYEVPAERDMRIIEVLDHVHDVLGHDLAYRWYCGTKKCGTCTVMVNGAPALACWEPALAEMTIEPLANFPVVRDLVVDRASHEATLRAIEPLLARMADYPGFPEPLTARDMAPGAALRECIQCLACTGACPVMAQPESGFAGPAPLVALAELALDPRDGADRARIADEVARVFECVSCYQCEAACPAEIPIVTAAIEPLKRLAYRRGEGEGARHARDFLDVVKTHGRVSAPHLALRAKGLSMDALRTGVRMAVRGKVDVLGALTGKGSGASGPIRALYEASEDEE